MFEWVKSRLGGPGGVELLRRAEALRARGKLQEARACCEELLQRSPDHAGACCLMANIAADARNTAAGLEWARRALAADPRSADAHYASGRLLEAEGKLPEAEASYRAALALRPDDARTRNNLGGVLHMQGRLDEALASYRAALELEPELPEANQNYASIARDAAALEQAIAGYQRQIAANPDDAAAHLNLANTCRELGHHAQALAAYESAVRAAPDYAEARLSRALTLLLVGDYREGWKEYEWRRRVSPYNAPLLRFPASPWDGRHITGAVLLHAEQGLGDTIQFVRYAPLVAQRCSSVILECQPELKSLLADLKGVDQVVSRGAALPPFAEHVPLMSLPYVFGTTLDSIPWEGPYLRADPARTAAWSSLLTKGGRTKVGLVWAGKPQLWEDRKRSLALASLAPLAQVQDVAFYSLQMGEAAAQAGSPPAGMRLIDLTSRIRDFSDTAALISHLDLVISVDTSVAHLAGAMGVPVWTLLPRAPDWRWHLDRSDNPWYPTMRLYRQEADGDWSAPVARMAQALRDRP